MKVKHNKKRNTAFVYEALIREATVSILKGDHERKQKVVSVIKKHFTPSSLLKKDLECYRSLYENQNIDRFHSEKIIKEAMTSISSSEYHMFSIPLEVTINSGNNWGEAH